MAQASQPDQPAKAGRDLNDAIIACFAPETETPPFPDRLIELATALTNQRNVAIWAIPADEETPTVIAQDALAETGEAELEIARDTLIKAGAAATMRVAGQYVAARIALPDGRTGALLLALPGGASMARSLAYERVTLLANLSFAQFRHADLTAQSKMIHVLTEIARGDRSQMQGLADMLAQLMGADYAAAGYFDGAAVSDLAISGQIGMTKRAQLPAKLRGMMHDIATKTVRSHDRYFASAPGRRSGLALIVEKPSRNIAMVQLAGAVFGQAQQGKPASRWTRARLAKMAAVLLGILAIGLIPVTDGTDIPASVESAQRRIVTAPLSATVAEVLVRDKQQVTGGETVLLRLDTREIDIEIIGATAERANAVLERETARASRNAALLRNAELEVERLEARIALLELQRDSGVITAPISGIAVLDSLEQRVGATVRQGENLLEVSDPSAMRLSLSIVESQASKVSEADEGVFRPDFDPSLRLPATVSAISPAVDNREEIPVILGKAEFNQPADMLRPGLRGVFAVGQTRRPIGQIIYRNIRNWVLLRVWL